MTEKMRAKFRCQSNDGDGNSKTAKLTTEYSDSPEDNQFNEATPWGNIEIGIDKKGAMGFLKPGKSYYVDFTEVLELEKAGPDDIPKDETDEARLYRKKEIKVEDFGGGFMLADYSGGKAPALFCGESMDWINQPIVQDPFSTRDEAVKAGMSQIDEKAPA